MSIKAVIFDLDGVIVSTDDFHYEAWKQMASEEGIPFDRDVNQRLRGVSRMESLEIVIGKAAKKYTEVEKTKLAERKNIYYRILLDRLTPENILPGVMSLLDELKKQNVKMAIGSSSKNTPFILEKIGLNRYFDAVADGNEIKKSKPDPEVFLLAANKLGVSPCDCIVVEDAIAGIEAAKAGGMQAFAVGFACSSNKADKIAISLQDITISDVIL